MKKKDGRDLVSEAVSDAKALKEAALAAAKNELLESMAPAIKELLEKNIKGVLSKNEDTDRIRRGIQDNWPGESHTGFEEAKEKGDPKMDPKTKLGADDGQEQELDLEALTSFFPALAEMPEEDPFAAPGQDDPSKLRGEDPSQGFGGIPTLGEAEDDEEAEGDKCAPEDDDMQEAKKKDDDKEEDKMDEEIEISEAELKKVYEAALQTEAQVTKGFGEMTPAGEIDDVVKDVDKGLADVKKGEHVWASETPPAKQDFMVKEMIQKGLAENKALRENLKKAVTLIRALGSRLHEVNLFNAKVLHVNRVLNKHGRLSTEQKKVVLETIDKAKTIDEVKLTYEAITNSFAAAHTLSESKSRKPTANAQRPRTSGTPDQKVLSESVDRNNNGFARLQQLAGLVK